MSGEPRRAMRDGFRLDVPHKDDCFMANDPAPFVALDVPEIDLRRHRNGTRGGSTSFYRFRCYDPDCPAILLVRVTTLSELIGTGRGRCCLVTGPTGTGHDAATVLYRLSWESVSAMEHPELYNWSTDRARQDIDRETIPEDWWRETSEETTDPWQQYNGLRQLVREGELIRNVRLFKASVTPPEWEEVSA